MKKYAAEFIGTAVLVTLGCGTAMLVGCDAASGGGYILTALAFGLVIVGMAGVNGSILAGLLVEIVLTFIFVLTILGVTDKTAGHGSFAGIVIGLTLTLVHILGIGLTGTSVNPARSLGPAIVAAVAGNTAPIACVWVFIVGPLAGGALAAVVYKALRSDK